MLFDLANVLVFVAIAAAFLAVTLGIGRLIRPATADPHKSLVYECGEAPLGAGWFNFNPRFVVVALVFLVFDVEVAFTYPVAVVFRRFIGSGEAMLAFFEIAAFVLVLALGLAYVWVRGDLEWLRGLAPDEATSPTDEEP